MKKFLFVLLPFGVFAQMPTYYDGINFSATNEDLRAELSDLITSTHRNHITYTPGVWDALLASDLVPDDPSKVLLIYGYDDNSVAKNHRTRNKELTNNGGCGSCEGRWEREHVFPKSRATPALDTDDPSAGTDAHNLRAVDRQMNSSRSNRTFAESNGNAGLVGAGFYPGDEWIGDVARILMYMFVRYETQCNANDVVYNATNLSHAEMPDLLLKWNAIDPPSEFEMVRNEVLAEIQGNRNPFIDNPYIATLTWGGQTAPNTWSELSSTDYNLQEVKVEITPNPTTSIATINSNQFVSANLYNINGSLLQSVTTKDINLSSYPAGVYILAITLDNGTIVTKKVIKK